MQEIETAQNEMIEMQNFLKWLSKEYLWWEYTWDGTFSTANSLDKIETIKKLQEDGRYPQILTLVFDFNNELSNIAICSIIEVIAKTWGKEQWDEVISKVISNIK